LPGFHNRADKLFVGWDDNTRSETKAGIGAMPLNPYGVNQFLYKTYWKEKRLLVTLREMSYLAGIDFSRASPYHCFNCLPFGLEPQASKLAIPQRA